VAGFTQDQEAMAKGAAAVDNASKEIHKHLQVLQGHVDHMRSKWTGGAARSFTGASDAFGQQAQKLNGALQNMHDALVQTKIAYAGQEENESSSFNNIASQL
jgi:WXG100 family type VII secretion target